MRFEHESWVVVAVAVTVALALAFALDMTRRRRVLEKIGHAPQLLRMAASASMARRGLKAVLTVAAVALILLALARPQVEGETEWRQRGIDIVIVVDFSKSMLAMDVHPSRTERAKIELDRLIDRFAGDRVAIVAFAGEAIHYPLTTDYEAAKILYHGLGPHDLPPGSDIGQALRTARCILRPDLKRDPDCERVGGSGRGGDPLDEDEARRERERRLEVTDLGDRARAIVLLTDGEDTEGRARAEVEKAARLGIEVFIVGIGTREGAPIPVYDDEGRQTGWKKHDDGSHVVTRLDETALKELAKAGGGEDHYYRVHPRRIGLENMIAALGKLKEGDYTQRVVKKPVEAFQWFLFPAFLLLVIEACLSERRRVRDDVRAVRREKRA